MGGGEDGLQKRHKGISGVMEMFYISVEEVITGSYTFTRIQQILHFRFVQCKFYLKGKTPHKTLISGNSKLGKFFLYAGYLF